MVLAVVRDLREQRAPAGSEELAEFETDVLALMVLGCAQGSMRSVPRAGCVRYSGEVSGALPVHACGVASGVAQAPCREATTSSHHLDGCSNAPFRVEYVLLRLLKVAIESQKWSWCRLVPPPGP